MSQQEIVVKAIHNVIKVMMDNVMNRVLITDPFLPDVHKANKPLYAALVPDEIFKGSHFERRFVTPFGNAWEKLAKIVANDCMGECVTQHPIKGVIKRDRLVRISEILYKLEHGYTETQKIKPNWDEEIEYILKGEGELIPVTVICDVFVISKITNKKYSFEVKAPMPNSDQCKVSKEKIFKLYAMEQKEIDEAFFAFPYNPYGTRENYTWSIPLRWFDMKTDKVILMGDEFWDLLGGVGTYKLFITELNKLGSEYKLKIYKEYLVIEPPNSNQLNTENCS